MIARSGLGRVTDGPPAGRAVHRGSTKSSTQKSLKRAMRRIISLIMAIWKSAFAVSAEALDVSCEAAVDAGPGEGALDDPARRLHDEPGVGALDDLDWTRGGRGNARPLVTGVREDALEEREAPGDPVEDQRRAVAILHPGGVDLDAQHQAEGVGDQVPLAALDPLSRIVSDHFAGFRAGFHALAVDDRRRGALSRPSSSRVRR